MLSEKSIKDTFDQVHSSEQLLKEVLDMTTRGKRKGHSGARAGRAAMLAAALVAALSVTAVAASHVIDEATNGQSTIAALFGNGGEYAEGPAIVEYDESGRLATNLPAWSKEAVDAAVADELVAPHLYSLEENTFVVGGFTYTVDAVLYDSSTNATMIYWSVENPNGLGDYGVGPNGEVFLLETSAMRWVVGGKSYVDTANSSDNLLRVCSYDVELREDIEIQLGACLDPENGKHAKSYDVQKVLIPRHDLGGMPNLTLEDGTTISPVAIRLEGVGETNLDSLVISYDDGSEYVVLSSNPSVDNTAYGIVDDQGRMTYVFNRIVDINAIEAVHVKPTGC